MWTLYFTKQAQMDARKLASSGLKTKAQQLLAILQSDPWQNPPPFEKLKLRAFNLIHSLPCKSSSSILVV